MSLCLRVIICAFVCLYGWVFSTVDNIWTNCQSVSHCLDLRVQTGSLWKKYPFLIALHTTKFVFSHTFWFLLLNDKILFHVFFFLFFFFDGIKLWNSLDQQLPCSRFKYYKFLKKIKCIFWFYFNFNFLKSKHYKKRKGLSEVNYFAIWVTMWVSMCIKIWVTMVTSSPDD